MADGTIFEVRGLQAAAIITHSFKRAAESMAARRGFEGYRYAVVPHPVSSLNAEQVRQRAAEVLPQVLDILGITDAPPVQER